jgi:hypothetical protein
MLCPAGANFLVRLLPRKELVLMMHSPRFFAPCGKAGRAQLRLEHDGSVYASVTTAGKDFDCATLPVEQFFPLWQEFVKKLQLAKAQYDQQKEGENNPFCCSRCGQQGEWRATDILRCPSCAIEWNIVLTLFPLLSHGR